MSFGLHLHQHTHTSFYLQTTNDRRRCHFYFRFRFHSAPTRGPYLLEQYDNTTDQLCPMLICYLGQSSPQPSSSISKLFRFLQASYVRARVRISNGKQKDLALAADSGQRTQRCRPWANTNSPYHT